MTGVLRLLHSSVAVYTLPKVLSVSHVPGCGVTDHIASIIGMYKHRVSPEVVKHLVKAHRHEELLSFLEKLKLGPTLKFKMTGREFLSIHIYFPSIHSIYHRTRHRVHPGQITPSHRAVFFFYINKRFCNTLSTID